VETLTDFVKNLTLLELLTIVVAAILTPIGIVTSIAAKKRKAMYWLLAIGLVPLLLSVLSLCVQKRALDYGLDWFGRRMDAEAIARGWHEALISSSIGAMGTVIIVSTTLLALRRRAK
jgi:hypothetical protein